MTTTVDLNTALNARFEEIAPHLPQLLGEDLMPSFNAQFTNALPSDTLKVGDISLSD